MIVDTHLLVNFADDSAIADRLPMAWREYLSLAPGLTNAPIGLTSDPCLVNPLGNLLAEAVPTTGERGASDLKSTIDLHLDRHGITRALVGHDAGRAAVALPNPRLSAEAVRACNAWMIEEVLPVDDRLYGTLLLPMHSPEDCARIIREAAANPRWGAVALAANNLGQPFGHPIYHPIYQAAAETGLPIVIDSGTDAWLDVMTNPTAIKPLMFTDLYTLASHSMGTHLISLVGQGVFELWPDLKVFLVGAGVAWITPYLWRVDNEFKAFHRDAPELSLLPSEYVARNVRIGTYSLDRLGAPAVMQSYMSVDPALRNVLCYASGYPAWDCDSPDQLETALPREWLPQVRAGNALDFFRWPASATTGVAG